MYIDCAGNKFNIENNYLYERRIHDGLSLIYQQNEKDVALLIAHLKSIGTDRAELLDADAWLRARCYKSDNRCTGGCNGDASCQEVDDGHGSYCACIGGS